MLKPYILFTDSNKNELKIELASLALNEKKHRKYIIAERSVDYCVGSRYLYNITPDIIVDNNEIIMPEIEEYIPPHEILDLELSISSQVACAFDIQMTYQLDDVKYSEDKMGFIIYNPDINNKRFEYTNKFLEIE